MVATLGIDAPRTKQDGSGAFTDPGTIVAIAAWAGAVADAVAEPAPARARPGRADRRRRSGSTSRASAIPTEPPPAASAGSVPRGCRTLHVRSPAWRRCRRSRTAARRRRRWATRSGRRRRVIRWRPSPSSCRRTSPACRPAARSPSRAGSPTSRSTPRSAWPSGSVGAAAASAGGAPLTEPVLTAAIRAELAGPHRVLRAGGRPRRDGACARSSLRRAVACPTRDDRGAAHGRARNGRGRSSSCSTASGGGSATASTRTGSSSSRVARDRRRRPDGGRDRIGRRPPSAAAAARAARPRRRGHRRPARRRGSSARPVSRRPTRRCSPRARAGASRCARSRTGAVTGTEMIGASDVDDELRAVTRRLLALAASGIRFDRMAVVMPAVEPYARTIAAMLDAAGIPYNGPSSRRLGDSIAGRAVARLVRMVESDFGRDEVMALLAAVPMRTPSERAGTDRPVGPCLAARRRRRRRRLDDAPGALRDRAERTRRRPRRGRHRGRRRVAAHGGCGTASSRRSSPSCAPASRRSSTPRAGGRGPTTWRPRSTRCWSTPARRRRWPEEEVEALDAVHAALARLADLDPIEPDPSAATFARALENELRVARGRHGRYGDGIVCVPLGAAVGLDHDVVAIVGMAEGSMPNVRREDALVAESDRALAVDGELVTRTSFAADQRTRVPGRARRCRRTHRILSAPRGDLRTGRERAPSRFFLDTASALSGRRVFSSDFATLTVADGLDAVPSFAAGLTRVDAAATAMDRELGVVAAAVRAGDDAAESSRRRRHPGRDRHRGRPRPRRLGRHTVGRRRRHGAPLGAVTGHGGPGVTDPAPGLGRVPVPLLPRQRAARPGRGDARTGARALGAGSGHARARDPRGVRRGGAGEAATRSVCRRGRRGVPTRWTACAR